MSMRRVYDQQETLRGRLPIVAGLMIIATVYLTGQLVSFQTLPPQVVAYMQRQANYNYNRTLQLAASRGVIYDRDGQPFALNTLEYEIGLSPNLIANPRSLSTQLAAILNQSELEIYDAVTTRSDWVQLARPVSADVAQQVRDLELIGITINPLPRRLYPQGTLAAQVIGFVAGDDSGAQGYRGYNGVEGYYEDELAGRVRDQQVSNIPFDLPSDRAVEDRGSDLVLTIDRDIQFLIESELQAAVTSTGSTQGTIIVMNPRNGDILGMASYPSFDPNNFIDVDDPDLLKNPAISDEYEPGSVFKVLTMAAALEAGTVTQYDTYVDNGIIEVGGVVIPNWDRQAHGVVDMTQMLVQSLNVGLATVSTSMGPSTYYGMMDTFRIGKATGIDMEGEEAGTLYVPGDEFWSESNLGTNAFGQGVAVTPLQLVTAVSAIANGGLMMQPHIVHQVVDGNRIYPSQPSTLGRPISVETAQIVTDMMVQVVEQGATRAQVPGYSVAGKTGTAQISTPIGYEAGASIASFVGFLPADDPQVIILVKLDRPTEYWGSVVAAPVFSRLAERLVIMMGIPPDDIRRALAIEGGAL